MSEVVEQHSWVVKSAKSCVKLQASLLIFLRYRSFNAELVYLCTYFLLYRPSLRHVAASFFYELICTTRVTSCTDLSWTGCTSRTEAAVSVPWVIFSVKLSTWVLSSPATSTLFKTFVGLALSCFLSLFKQIRVFWKNSLFPDKICYLGSLGWFYFSPTYKHF